jgi:hypothetical protein
MTHNTGMAMGCYPVCLVDSARDFVALQRGDIFLASAMEMNSSSVRSGIWWGEATDEPAREDARPTEFAPPPAAPKSDEGGTGLGNSAARVATKISLLTELSDGARVFDPQQLRRFGGVWIIRRSE